jgi:Zn ribbon nucleic-acid-binding protein
MGKKSCSHDIDELNKGSLKPLKIRFCPGCKSTDVAFVFRIKNIFGLIPRVECTRCGHSSVDFPLLVVSKDALNKKAKSKKAVKKGKGKKKVSKKKVVRRSVYPKNLNKGANK